MKNDLITKKSTVIFLSHGGGPLPLLGDKGHQHLIDFIQKVTPTFKIPSAILVISAHWEEDKPTITSGAFPNLIYDYYGFPKAAYEIQYPAPGSPALANKIYCLLESANIEAKLDSQRGFDHSLFVPLKMMYPAANIPCVELSLVNTLNAEHHIQIGKALAQLRDENVLIIGSGSSFHNMQAFFAESTLETQSKNAAFEAWLIDTCANSKYTQTEREYKLSHWEEAPFARYCHPKEEHLLPLLVCCGVAGAAAREVYEFEILGKNSSAYIW
jgi:4,5-DOPA dioxygenase extradiol